MEKNELDVHYYYHTNDEVRVINYYLNGKYHRSDGPAREFYESNGDVVSVCYLHGRWHNNNGPAYYMNDGDKEQYFYCIDGELHRKYGPSKVLKTKKTHKVQYHRHGKLHNEFGPAQITDGVKTYFINDKKIDCEDIMNIPVDTIEKSMYLEFKY